MTKRPGRSGVPRHMDGNVQPVTSAERTFTVTTPLPTVLDYLKDFSHAEEWDPGTRACTRTDAGPLGVGATWRNVSKFAGRETTLTYTLREAGANRLTFIGENSSATSTDRITLQPDGHGTRINYRAQIEFHGLARLGAPFLKPMFERIADKTQERMIEVINALPRG